MGRTLSVNGDNVVVDDVEMERLRRLARLLDSSIQLPFGYRAGVDSVIGLIPGFGDAFGAALSAWIIMRAARLGVSNLTLAHMVWNALVEAVIGMVPVAGDLFDIAWKANLRNLALLESRVYGTPYRNPSDSRTVWLVLGLVALLVLLAIGALWLIIKLFQALL